MMRKRKTVVAKRITPKVMTGIPKSFGILNDPLGNQVESKLMEKEEADQRRYDRFWGQDKDLQDRELERYRLAEEDTASLANEKWYETVEIHRRWDEEYQRNLWFENRSQAKYKEIERREYLKFVNSSLSSDEVINFVWGSKAGGGGGLNSLGGESNSNNKGSAHRSLIFSDLSAINREVALSLPATVGALHMSVHLDGLQQAKAIVDGASTAFKQTLRRINNQTALDGETSQPFKTNALAAAIIKKKEKGNQGGPQAQQHQHQPQQQSPGTKKGNPSFITDATEASVFEAEQPPRPIAAIEGHALHKWDQELMLQLAFMGLDKGGKGYLTGEEVAGVSFDAKTHGLLSFTVFWANIKKRHWSFFQCMGSSSNNAPAVASSGSSTQDQQGSRGDEAKITLRDWMAAAEKLSAEEAVPLRHIRTQEEHVRISEGNNNSSSSSRHQPLSSRGAGAANVFSGLPEREHRVSRQLAEGDVVWSLHHGGVLWLPAVVRAVHFQPPQPSPQPSSSSSLQWQRRPSGHSSTVTYSDYRYDLWFPISQKDLLKARSAMAARQLLALPSQQLTQQTPGDLSDPTAPTMLPPKPLSEERRVCAYAFDLVDSAGEGIVQLPRLVQCLQSREFSRVVATSLALSTIFHGGSRVRRVDADEHEQEKEKENIEENVEEKEEGKKEENKEKGGRGSKKTAAGKLGQLLLLAAGTADIPSLLPVFIDTFSAPASAAAVAEPEEAKEEEEDVEVEVEVEVEEDDPAGEGIEGEGKGSVALSSSDISADGYYEDAAVQDSAASAASSEGSAAGETVTIKKKMKKIVKVKRAAKEAGASSSATPQAATAAATTVDWISKLDFLEFCQAVVDVKRYSVCIQ